MNSPIVSRAPAGAHLRRRLLFKLYTIGGALFAFGVLARWLGVELFAEPRFAQALADHRVAANPELAAALMELARNALMWSNVISLTTAVAVGMMLRKIVIARIQDAILVTRRVASGDFTARVPAGWKDEIDELGHAFNTMTGSLRRMEEARRELLLDISHDLRGPLMNMRGYLDAIHSGALPADADAIAALREETTRVATLADGLSRLTTAEAASTNVRTTEVDLAESIAVTLDLFSYAFRQKDIDVHNTAVSPTPLLADADKIRQILYNLIDNACRYTPAGGQVHVRVESFEDRIRTVIENSASPLSNAEAQQVFERFYRSPGGDSAGTGIGLAIVKELVEAHGGSVGAQPVQGANRFWFELPRNPSNAPERD